VATVVVIEDEEPIAAAVAARLRSEGFDVEVAADGPSGVALVERAGPDLVVLDLMLPGFDGLEVCRRIQKDRPVPVLMLTARDSETDLLVGLAVGADDYLTKPFSPQELVLRVAAILRRMSAGGNGASDVLAIGALRIDRAAHRVTVESREIELTPTEYKLLLTLADRRGRVQARSHLLETVWEAAPDIQTRTVDMHVQRLRTKLGAAGDLIETVRGFGYRLRAAGQSRSA